MRRAIRGKSRTKKPLFAGAACALTAALLLSGVFAWTDFTQSRTNKFRGQQDADVCLHDEFDETGENGVFDKDVFVENSGHNTVYVRVRLDEYMQVGDTVFDSSADPRDKNTWTPHTYDGASILDSGNADAGKYYDYYEWEMSGAKRGYNPGTPGMVYTRLGADGKVDTTTGTEQTANAAPPVKLSAAVEIGGKVAASEPLTDEEEAAWDAILAGVWLLDDTDEAANGGGWAYWSAPLKIGEATNLLLDKVTLRKEPVDDWIYRIDVKLQAVTSNDFIKWDAGAQPGYRLTESAEALVAFWNQPA
jgi:hypothetical protein